MNRSAELQVQLESAWWAWHDADSSRWSELDDAEERCEAWVSGESSDGPPPRDLDDDAACRADHEYDQRRDDALMFGDA